MRATNASKSSIVPSSGSIASCPPSAEPIAHGEPTSPGPGVHGVVAALAVHGADRVDRRQVDDVEAHRGDAVELLGRGDERAVHRAAGLVAAAGGAREELVPGAEEGALAVDVDLLRPAAGDQLADRALGHDRRRRPGTAPGATRACSGSAVSRSALAAPNSRSRLVALGGRRPTRCSSRAPISRSLASSSGLWPASSLTCDGVAPGGPRVAPGVDAEGPQARARRRTTMAANRSVPMPVGRPSGRAGRRPGCRPCFQTTLAATASWPSRQTVAPIGTTSPTTALLGWRPSPTAGRDVVDTQPTGHRLTPQSARPSREVTNVPTRSGPGRNGSRPFTRPFTRCPPYGPAASRGRPVAPGAAGRAAAGRSISDLTDHGIAFIVSFPP